ncbi:hypothetical protein O181_009505 [Austropuccinia psidii MF-1]|uniref:Copia protein n=1 Tax=Austropuccinia psidii MF-1 TaxID=1389203 RepID=A0A9Q3BRF3_9BASI|nr:hypothetical protein [Austropuccinia psidii MF-1]
MTEGTQDLQWISNLIFEITNERKQQILYSNNQSAISIASNHIYHHRTRHVNFRLHFIRNLIKEENLKIEYLNTNKMIADLLTKNNNYLKSINHLRLIFGNQDLSNIVQTIDNPSTIPLIPENEIITFRGVKPGKKKITCGIINLTDFFIKYVLALLSKVEISRWTPDLNASSDTLYNEACHISAIQTFCQLAAGGAYEYMNINLRFLEDLKLLEET